MSQGKLRCNNREGQKQAQKTESQLNEKLKLKGLLLDF
jgi:hypothetical protein